MTKLGYFFDAAASLFRPLSGGTNLVYTQPKPPNPPTGVTNTAVVPDGWKTTWVAPTTGLAPAGYRVLIGGVQVGEDVPSSILTLSISGQAPSTTYSVTVKSFNNYGESNPSTAASVTTSALPVGVPDAPTGVANGSITNDGWTTTWLLSATGAAPTGYRVLINSVKYNSDLPLTPRSIAISGKLPGTYNVVVKAVNAIGASLSSAVVPVTVTGTTDVPTGLIANRVIAGWFASPESHNNTPAHAEVMMDSRNDSIPPGAWWSGTNGNTIPGGLFHKKNTVAKKFNPGSFVTGTELLSNLAAADADGYYLLQTTKVSNDRTAAQGYTTGGDWAGVAAGNYDSYLDVYATIAKNRIAAGKRGFAISFHHEPHGNNPGDMDSPIRTASSWAAMQEYSSYYFSGRTTGANKGHANGTYVAADDVRAGMSYVPVPNGFLFTGSATLKAELDVLVPRSLCNALNVNQAYLCADLYDATNPAQTLTAKVQAMYAWCRSPVGTQPPRGVNHAAVAEFGPLTADSLDSAWAALKNHVDLFRYVIYWDSGNGPESQKPDGTFPDWRLLPNGYPTDNCTNCGPMLEPGNAESELRLLAWRVAVAESEAMT